jgi:hypothetical protein
MATVAVFVALGGISYAVATGSINSRELKNNSIRSTDLRNNNVRSKDVRNGSLLARDFRAGQLPAGPRGDTGPRGAPGKDATSLFAYIRDQGASSPATVAYGSGVTSVEDPGGDSGYTVTFDRDLTNCVAVATTGVGEPAGAAAGGAAFGEFVEVAPGGQVRVDFFDTGIVRRDGSFMIMAFC